MNLEKEEKQKFQQKNRKMKIPEKAENYFRKIQIVFRDFVNG